MNGRRSRDTTIAWVAFCTSMALFPLAFWLLLWIAVME